MADLPLRLTCADYARVMPLAVGDVKPDGIDLTMVLGREGSWPARAEMLRRAASDPTVQGGESSMAGHLRRIDQGDRSLVALPVFPLRNFTGRDLYVRKAGPIKTPADLRGGRVGMYDWVASGSIWYRHFLRFIGVPPEDLQWTIGPVDEPNITSHVYTLPEGVRAAPEGRALSEMLVASELDAIYSPPRPRRYHPVDGPIARLFPDIRTIERAVFPCHAHVPAAASHRSATRNVAAEQMDRALSDRCIRSLHRDVRQGAAVVPVCIALARRGTGGNRGADGRRLPRRWFRTEPCGDRGVHGTGVSAPAS